MPDTVQSSTAATRGSVSTITEDTQTHDLVHDETGNTPKDLGPSTSTVSSNDSSLKLHLTSTSANTSTSSIALYLSDAQHSVPYGSLNLQDPKRAQTSQLRCVIRAVCVMNNELRDFDNLFDIDGAKSG